MKLNKEYSEPLLKVVELHSFWSKERDNGNPRGYFGPRFLKTILKEKVCRLSEKSAGPMASWLGRAHLAWEMVRQFDSWRTRLSLSLIPLQTFTCSSSASVSPTAAWERPAAFLLTSGCYKLMNLWKFPHASKESCDVNVTVVPFFFWLYDPFSYFHWIHRNLMLLP